MAVRDHSTVKNAMKKQGKADTSPGDEELPVLFRGCSLSVIG
jgi:hypothetical protein